ncbi:Aspartic peptidase, partial [Cynara cardunculus var. scolymus]
MWDSFISRSPATLRLSGIAVALLLQGVVVLCKSPATLKLERVFPHDNEMELSELRHRDNLRHARILLSEDIIDFPLQGTYDPYRVGLYFTKVLLGSPPREYHVQVDTGSDVLWVSCKDCKGCPTSSGLHIPIEFYDPSKSATSTWISCYDARCNVGIQSSSAATCSTTNTHCNYTFKYGDGSATSGYFVSDKIELEMYSDETSLLSHTSSTVLFGCSTSQSGELSSSERAVDGIFGFGQQGLSIISQLASEGEAPNSFSHCLIGGGDGGGILVFGQIIDPKMVYSPLVPSQPHYNLNLLSISVNGHILPIDPAVFGTKNNRKGTIIDSGTTLAYLTEEAYKPFVDAVSTEGQCAVTKGLAEAFPLVHLTFAGDATMVLKPQNYLLPQKTVDGQSAWCIGFQKVDAEGMTILG